MEYLFDKLRENGESDIYPYHMPGHKRHAFGRLPEELYLRDITEIEGFDNLHQPEGMFLALQQRAAGLYGAEESFYLVNGSTGGILSAVSAALPVGGHILMSRNCHKSAYHAAYLKNLTVSYLYPEILPEYDIFDSIKPEQVYKALEREAGIGAVLIVSPTYEGRISDIREIAKIVHERQLPLIVDEAHGAHLGWAEGFAENSCQAGADLVIHSVHKTLPALTQAALLHVNGNLIDRGKLRRFLHIYQSSSPSYLLMASIDNALRCLSGEGRRAFDGFIKNWNTMLERLSECRRLRFLTGPYREQDVGKLLISVKGTGVSGAWLYDRLLRKYHLQMEMAAETYVLAMFTLNDTQEGYERLTAALLETDKLLERSALPQAGALPDAEDASAQNAVLALGVTGEGISKTGGWKPDKRAIPLAQAWEMETREQALFESIGDCSGEFVNLYPPGVPVLVPGEHISREICEKISDWVKQGLNVQGVWRCEGVSYVRVLRT